MSLMKMGSATESVRFLDDVDFTFSLDSRSSSLQQITNIELFSKPIVFRASYRDINLITSIVNKAIERYGSSQQSLANVKKSSGASQEIERSGNQIPASQRSGSNPAQSTGKARVSMSKELVSFLQNQKKNPPKYTSPDKPLKFKGSFDGFRLVLIGDLHEQPMLHLKLKPFIVGAQDWTGQVSILF